MSSKLPRGIIVGHGDFATGLLSAVQQICGLADVFAAVSNRDYPAEDLDRVLRHHVASGAEIIFTDLPGGSAATAARRVMRDNPKLVLVTGANLAALLEFALGEQCGPSTAARTAVEKGRSSMNSSGGE
ncbi:MAG: PTS sugar transporter subunit IIA [Gemmatimonadaceae bacterium]